jgi:ATP-dependent DNA helicase RecG
MSNMTAAELQAWLQANFPKENERHEWKGWANLRYNISAASGDDLISYASALSNMEGGVVVIGAEDQTLRITGIQNFAEFTPENLPLRVLGNCVNLPSEGLTVDVYQTSDTSQTVWLVHVPKHAARQVVVAHRKAWQRVGDSLVELRPERREAILREPLAGIDWSAEVVPAASLADLDPAALQQARKKYFDRNVRKPWHAEIKDWSDATFLDKARLSINGQITRAALILLGRLQSTHLLSPYVAEITWKLPDESAVEHFGPPFILTTTEVLGRIRNFNIKLYPQTRLLAEEVPKYDTEVILEALYNCIAHQDYDKAERIVLEERRGHLSFQNAGTFVDGQPELYLQVTERTPSRYRNKWLAQAMIELDMIDTAGFGIRKMFLAQRRRFLPLPDYDFSAPQRVRLQVYGQVIDKNYTQLLMDRSDLALEYVLWLDRVQKKLSVSDSQAQELRRAKLIEGRKPNHFVSASVANATNTRSQYTKNKGLNDAMYKQFIVQHITKFKQASIAEMRELLTDKLPASLTTAQKESKIKNLLSALRMVGLNGQRIKAKGDGKRRHWVLDAVSFKSNE